MINSIKKIEIKLIQRILDKEKKQKRINYKLNLNIQKKKINY